MIIIIEILFVCFLVIGVKSSGFGSPSMPPTILTLQMIIDFVEDGSWKQVVFFDCIGTEDCNRPYARPLLECFLKKGVLVAIKSLTEQTDIADILKPENSRVGVILLIDDIDLESDENVLNKVMMKNKNMRSKVFGEYTSWLIVSTKWNNTQIFSAIKEWPIGVDSDVTIAMSFLAADVVLSVLHQFENKTCDDLRIYGLSYDYERLRRSQSVSPPEATFVQDTENTSRTIMVFYMVRVYKIRMEENASLEKENWIFWSPSRQFINKERKLLSHRNNLRKNYMKFGLQNNSKSFGNEEDVNDAGCDDNAGSVESYTELVKIFEKCLNVTANITTYVFHDSAQSAKDNNDLVHAITGGEIDIGFYLDADLYRNKLLYFSYPITHYKRSIYFKTPETSSNIFLQPFSPRLLLCVIGTLALIVMVMEIINYVTLFIHWKEDAEHFGIGEATLWCLSIICMQGSPWTPRTRAGKTVLLASLIFALIIYNSFSGFITSILSFKSNSIHNVTDFANFEYIYGCSKHEESYIIQIPELRNFYVKTLEGNQKKISDKEGLDRAIKGGYIFFVAETVAKRIFRGALMFKRCEVDELCVEHTRGNLALPMSTNSPYKKIINISILRMWQYGILHKLNEKIKPKLLDCKRSSYKEATFMDVYGAFIILGFGAVAAVLLFFCERTWASRQSLRRRITERHRGGAVLRSQPQTVLVTARLPMKILGIDRDLRGRPSWDEFNSEPATTEPLKTSALGIFLAKTQKKNGNKKGEKKSSIYPYQD